MPETTGEKPATGTLYRDLVWLAYLVLPDRGTRTRRIALARRIADAAVAGRPHDPRRRRTRVLRRAVRPPRRLALGLGPWTRALPVPLPAPALTDLLGTLDPPVRIAYVLRRLAGMPGYEVRDQLTRLRVADPAAVLAAAEAAPEPPEVPAPFPPAQVRPVRRRSLVPVTAGVALTATLVGALAAGEAGRLGVDGTAAARDLRVTAAAPDAWRTGPHRLDAWPARGDLASDRDFTGRAARAFATADRTGPDRAQLLFAGRVGGRPVALLRRAGRVARFAGGSVEVVSAGEDAETPLALGDGHYLLPPWTNAVTTPAGRAVPVRSGVTDPVAPTTRCGRGPLFDQHGPGTAVRTIGHLGGPRPLALSYRMPGTPPVTRLTGGGLHLWERLGCALPQPARPLGEARAYDFWSGQLPFEGGRGDWTCTRLTFAGGGTTSRAVLLTPRAEQATGWCDEARPVAGTWWRAPSGRWAYIAAARRDLTPSVDGRPRRISRRGGLLIVPGPNSPHTPPGTFTASAR
ncbi:hypothetical protein [Actinomadura rayongensis]|uniref:Uncharacterized protein n=1 Tax=Actinomadura rayongensis TaxID=1429076 RepID=A0A6I4WEW1_9ACTN|nr:hypothetical protein [Actinomadura rayongensis]MXQ67430.1 hypothetical protein [Actinomadura rayongensis]